MTKLEDATKELIEAVAERVVEIILPEIIDEVKSNTFEEASKSRTIDSTDELRQLPDILTPQHIAKYLGISRRRVYELLSLSTEHGGIPEFKIGASIRTRKSDFINWIEERINC